MVQIPDSPAVKLARAHVQAWASKDFDTARADSAPCQLRAGGLCAVRGKAPLLTCPGAAGRRECLMGVQLGFMGVQLGGKVTGAGFGGLRLRCGDRRAEAGGCQRASLMMKRRAAAAAVRPCARPGPGSPPSWFPQVTCLDRPGRPVLPPRSACEMRARPAPAVLAWSGDGSPVWGCTTTSGDQVPLGHVKSP